MKHIQYTKEYIEDAISSLSLSEELKENMQKSVFGPLAFYTFLPAEILKSSRADIESNKDLVCHLSLYAIYYVSSVIVTDKLIDSQLQETPQNSLFEYLFFIKEYAVRGLQKIVGTYDFWDNMDTYKKELFVCSKYTNHSFSGNEEELLDILVGKSSLVKAYPEAMRHIIGDTTDWKQLNKSLYDFHVAFQILDDYEDLIQDAKSDQLNYFLAKNKKTTNDDIDFQIKTIFINGSIVEGMEVAISYLKNSMDYFQKSGMNYLLAIAKKLYSRLANIRSEVSRLCLKAEVKAQLSNTFCPNNNLSNAIQLSLNYLYEHRNKKKLWSDFMTTAGKGESWVTAFVVCMLSEFKDNLPKLSNTISNLKLSEGTYNDKVIRDGDSMNFRIIALAAANTKDLINEINNWLYFKHDSGGFSTYRGNAITNVLNINPDSDVSGWTNEHNCVSAVALWVAQKLGLNEIYKETINFLSRQVRKDGSIASYWWTENIYSNAFCVMAGMRGKVLDYIINTRQTEGYWRNSGKPSIFYTAMAIKALECVTINDNTRAYVYLVTEGIDWLIKQQFSDGSWDSEYLLRIPAPNDHSPEKNKQWKLSSFGVNVITDDYERVFTTALVYNVIRTYEEQIA